MTSRIRFHTDESGIASVWTAIVLLFLLGATALAVDTSEFFQKPAVSNVPSISPAWPGRGTNRRSCDGRAESRAFRAAQSTGAHGHLSHVADHRRRQYLDVDDGQFRSGNGNTRPIQRGHQCRHHAGQSPPEAPTRFGKVLGADSTGIVQEAYCGRFTALGSRHHPDRGSERFRRRHHEVRRQPVQRSSIPVPAAGFATT